MAWSLCQSPSVFTGIWRLISWQDLQELADAPQAARAVSAGAQSAAATIAGAASASMIANHRLDLTPAPFTRRQSPHTQPPREDTDRGIRRSTRSRSHDYITTRACRASAPGPDDRSSRVTVAVLTAGRDAIRPGVGMMPARRPAPASPTREELGACGASSPGRREAGTPGWSSPCGCVVAGALAMGPEPPERDHQRRLQVAAGVAREQARRGAAAGLVRRRQGHAGHRRVQLRRRRSPPSRSRPSTTARRGSRAAPSPSTARASSTPTTARAR